MSENNSLPLHSPDDVDLKIFNAIKSPDYNNGKPIKDIRRLFHKQVILDDETILSVETIKIPGYIGIANSESLSRFSLSPHLQGLGVWVKVWVAIVW
jgi:hypothetical protein